MNTFKQKLLTTNSTQSMIIFCSLLLFIGMIGSLTIDMYVPSLPVIARSFVVTATATKYTLTIYLISYAFGQLFYGPFVDCFGRKQILLWAIVVGTIGKSLLLFRSFHI